MNTEIEATLIIKSPGDHLSYKGDVNASEAIVGDYLPDLHTVVTTARYFRNAGFKVHPHQDHVRIYGSMSQFEQQFDMHLQGMIDDSAGAHVRIPRLLEDVLVRVMFSRQLAQAS